MQASLSSKIGAATALMPSIASCGAHAYPDRTAFVDASAVLVSSEYARRHYARRIGLESTALPPPRSTRPSAGPVTTLPSTWTSGEPA